MTPEPGLKLRYMQSRDIPQVKFIDAASFIPPWPEHSYRFEISESNVSYMVVLQKYGQRPMNRLRQIWHNIQSNGAKKPKQKSFIAGYGGLWKIADEAHISTVASHPEFRGQRFGEILLAGMMRRAISLGAAYLVLEVRVSNQIAQNLYLKYGFEVQGIKARYYQNNDEDAYDMRLNLTPDAITEFEEQYRVLQQRLDFVDEFSHTLHPRLNR